MRRFPRTTLVVLVTCVALVAGTGVAAAQTDDADHERHLDGVGALWAKGTGEVELDVDTAVVGLRVDGDVTIIGPADLDVIIDGAAAARAPESGETIIVLDDFTGRIAVRGSDYTVSIEGEVALHGRGGGSASFLGTGWWKTLHKRGLWPADEPGTAIEFAPDAT